jgi:RNA polymerase sigma-70 factor (ECF subfamily)
MTEEELIEGCIKRDRLCELELYKKYYPLMSSLALRYIEQKDDALYELNYAYLKVLKSLKKYDSKYAIATWIRRICINYFIDVYRKKKKAEFVPLNKVENHSSINNSEYKWQEEDLRLMLSKLPALTRSVFVLYAIDGYIHKEIAIMLKIPEGTSRWHLGEARKTLKKMLNIDDSGQSTQLKRKYV